MRKVREFVRTSKAARAIVNTIGVGSFLALAFALTLWAFSYGRLLYLHGEREYEYLFVANAQHGHFEFFLDSFNGLKTSWLPPNAFEANSVDVTPDAENRFRARMKRGGFQFRFSLNGNLSIALFFPLWSLALVSLASLAAASAISFRFTIRTLLAAVTIGCLILGYLAYAVHHSREVLDIPL